MCALCTRQGCRRKIWTGRETLLHLHFHALVTKQLHARSSMPSSTPITPEERSRTHGQGMQQHTDLARFGSGVTIPLTLLGACGQGRQLRMLAAYTTRRLPSASRRRSWGISALPAGQRSVPSGWRGKSGPEKRPISQEVAVLGGPYPGAGAGEAGCVAACLLCGGMAGANSVVRRGVGSS
jgi:hypothetical protein